VGERERERKEIEKEGRKSEKSWQHWLIPAITSHLGGGDRRIEVWGKLGPVESVSGHGGMCHR
jgi:hypothetical protein